MSALASCRQLKMQALELGQGLPDSDLGGREAFEWAAKLRDVERKIVQEKRAHEERVEALQTHGMAMGLLYYEDVVDPILLLSRMRQVSEVIARGEFVTA